MSGIAFLFPILFFICLVPVFIGVYVWRDAIRRNMNAALWTIAAVFVPGLLGFLIYLLVRGNHSDLQCGKCGAAVNRSFVVCPSCGAKLKPSCPGCGVAVEPDWKVCPYCTQPLPVQQPVTPPVHAKDKSLWKILLLVFLIPLVLIGLILIANFSYGNAWGASSFQEVTLAQYLEIQEDEEIKNAVQNWLPDTRENLDDAYALHSVHQVDDNEYLHYFLISVPGAAESHTAGLGMNGGIFGTTGELQLRWTGKDDGLYNLMLSSSKKKVNLVVRRDDQKLSCHITEVDFNPTLYFLEDYEIPTADGHKELVLPFALEDILDIAIYKDPGLPDFSQRTGIDDEKRIAFLYEQLNRIPIIEVDSESAADAGTVYQFIFRLADHTKFSITCQTEGLLTMEDNRTYKTVIDVEWIVSHIAQPQIAIGTEGNRNPDSPVN